MRGVFTLPAARDARYFQMAGQASILALGLLFREFEINAAQIGAIFLTCLATQWLGAKLHAMRFDWKSPVITALALSLLLRADGLWPLMLAAAIAIASKFALRFYGKHVFNPANAGIVLMLLFSDAAWTTTGQWGTALWLAVLIALAGSMIAFRASRLDVPLVFLGAYAALVLGRAAFLGDPIGIPLLRLQNGALFLFAFFMISDPKTTPDGLKARMAFTAGAALIAYILQFHFFIADGIFYALFAMTLVRPLIDRAADAPRYEWGQAPAPLPLRPPAVSPAITNAAPAPAD